MVACVGLAPSAQDTMQAARKTAAQTVGAILLVVTGEMQLQQWPGLSIGGFEGHANFHVMSD